MFLMNLIVLRGLPGSGKTHFTENITNSKVIISNDNNRIIDGKYKYQIELNNKIYQENFTLLNNSMKNKESLIIIDNCNLNLELLNMYKSLAEKYEYKYFQIYFDKPSLTNLYRSFKLCQNNISFSSYKNLWKNYYKHNLDINIKDFNINLLK